MSSGQSQKFCCRCGQAKDPEQFSFRDQARAILHSYCRDCHRAWNRSHYERNRHKYLGNARRSNAVYRAHSLARVIDYLMLHPCIDCEETDLRMLDFDHRDRSTKRMAPHSRTNRLAQSA